MSKGICSRCKKRLTKNSSSPAIFKQGRGSCRACGAKYYQANKERKSKRAHEYYLRNTKEIKAKSSKRYYERRDEAVAYSANYYKNNKVKILLKIRTPVGRHKALCNFLRKEKVPKTDMLWRFNFYAELIKENCCHYCEGPLNETGLGLDAVHNVVGHRCYNVVPCCGSCNQKKMHDVSYESFMEIKYWLVKTRLKGLV